MKLNLDIEPNAIFFPCTEPVSGCYLILDLNIKDLQHVKEHGKQQLSHQKL